MSEIFAQQVGKYRITGRMVGVEPRVPNLIVQRTGRPPVVLSYMDLEDLYEGRRTFAMYPGIPKIIQKHVTRKVCSLLNKPFNMRVYDRIRTFRPVKPKFEVVRLSVEEILEEMKTAKPEERERLEVLLDEAFDELGSRLKKARELLEGKEEV